VEILILADTHVRADRRRDLPADVWAAAERAELILHAGDVVTPGLLEDLEHHAPVVAVLGNNDHGLERQLPLTWEEDVEGVRMAMIHDSGPTRGRARRMHRRFRDADVVVFGHSHQPMDDVGEAAQRLFNPGSPTERRRAPERTYGWLTVAAGRIVHHAVVAVTDPGAAAGGR
jgi:putative phosphoesterase